MIYINENARSKMKDWTDDTIHILADFDKTITDSNSISSWGVLSKSTLVSKEYIKDRNEFYNYYYPFEIDQTLDFETKNKLMIEWYTKHINLFVKYKLSENIVKDVAMNKSLMAFRKGAKEFLEDMNKRGIPVVIISAGIGNFVEQFLINNNCNFDNIYIVTNFIKFKNGIAVGVEDNIIHSLNKNEISIPSSVKEVIKNRPNIILLGDNIADIRMATDDTREQAFKIGFLEDKVEENFSYYTEAFDVVCTDNTSYNELKESVNLW